VSSMFQSRQSSIWVVVLGGHIILLAQRDYQVTGINRSDRMLKIAKEKAKPSGVEINFFLGDICTLDLACTFDAVISMFAVMSYQTTNADVAAACQTARRHLDHGGIFIFDAWHGPGVLTDPPTQRVKIVQDGARRVVRFTEPVVDVMNHTVETRFKVWTTEDNRIISEVDESHLMRFLFPQEVAYFLGVAGFNHVRFCPFMELDGKLDQSVWNVTVIVQC